MVGTSKKLVPVAWPVISGTTSQTMMSKNPLESLQLILVGKWDSHHDVWSPVVPRKQTSFFWKVSQISVDMNEPNKAISYPEIAQKVLGGRHTKHGHFIWMTSNRFQNWSVVKLMVYDTGILPEVGQWFNHARLCPIVNKSNNYGLW